MPLVQLHAQQKQKQQQVEDKIDITLSFEKVIVAANNVFVLTNSMENRTRDFFSTFNEVEERIHIVVVL